MRLSRLDWEVGEIGATGFTNAGTLTVRQDGAGPTTSGRITAHYGGELYSASAGRHEISSCQRQSLG